MGVSTTKSGRRLLRETGDEKVLSMRCVGEHLHVGRVVVQHPHTVPGTYSRTGTRVPYALGILQVLQGARPCALHGRQRWSARGRMGCLRGRQSLDQCCLRRRSQERPPWTMIRSTPRWTALASGGDCANTSTTYSNAWWAGTSVTPHHTLPHIPVRGVKMRRSLKGISSPHKRADETTIATLSALE